MTSFGILMPAIRPPKTVPADDNRTIQIRTRRKKDLEILRDEFMGDELGPIIATPQMDYNYRAYCTPEALARMMEKLAYEVDYEKFKPTTESKYNDHELHGVYNSIWSTVTRMGTPYEAASKGKYSNGYRWGDSYGSSEIVGNRYKPSKEDKKPSFREPRETDRDDRWGFEPEEVTNYGLGYPIKIKKKRIHEMSDAEHAELLSGMTVEEKAEELYAELAEIPTDMWSEVLTDEEFALVAPRIREAANRKHEEQKTIRSEKKNRRHSRRRR